jgi:hypothetical protein
MLIDSRSIVVEGVDCILTITADVDSTPFEFDCYTAEDIAAWRNYDWRYVGVQLGRNDADGNASLWGVEFGRIAGKFIGTYELINDPYMIADGVSYTLPETLFAEFELIERK